MAGAWPPTEYLAFLSLRLVSKRGWDHSQHCVLGSHSAGGGGRRCRPLEGPKPRASSLSDSITRELRAPRASLPARREALRPGRRAELCTRSRRVLRASSKAVVGVQTSDTAVHTVCSSSRRSAFCPFFPPVQHQVEGTGGGGRAV